MKTLIIWMRGGGRDMITSPQYRSLVYIHEKYLTDENCVN